MSSGSFLKSIYRNYTCGELNINHIGKNAKLCGWVHKKRDHGGILFIDLRDHYGIVQLVFAEDQIIDDKYSDNNENIYYQYITHNNFENLISISNESILLIEGTVLARSNDTINSNIPTGYIEVRIEKFMIDSIADPLPFQVSIDDNCSEEKRLEYRFVDLRKQRLHENISLRNKVIREIREQMYCFGFNEFQTPILTASSPEGARDFVVPSRNHPGKFYALPQAPQQFKQMLMIAGFDRYFQIAPCFRDEDARADRAPGEFYQLDIEMSFVDQEDVFKIIEPLMLNIFKKYGKKQINSDNFPRITYKDALLKYGSDKPDLRNPIIIQDVTQVFAKSKFLTFSNSILNNNFVVRAVPAYSSLSKSRSFFDGMNLYAQEELGAKGLGYIIFSNDNVKGPIAKFLNDDEIAELKSITGTSIGDSLFFICDVKDNASRISGKIRDKLGEDLNLINQNEYRFCWIVDFPMYELNDGKIDFSHNPFSMPQGGINILNEANTIEKILDITAFQYDLVCNGIELSSGAIRNHKLNIMYKAFEIAGYSKDMVDNNFIGMVKALSYGAPPHGGIAPGIDRMIMLLTNELNIREVIAFPLNQRGNDLMMGAPSIIDQKHLKELNIKIIT
ncbi:aspartate--tRNA ligase [Lyticum sinuosum]|uniref:Aspartate--tRNA(Asp/Asn) ligase n=1 Tax=Lyticum sinuosum TaxID=1332059 RepID=A0AAE4VLF6_9RICK|nr:aspartate--tRNA ligase [Lyticum sinuosum]MDZ5761639.1 Aspartate--tRNA ligase [Lyticum sinuosum]